MELEALQLHEADLQVLNLEPPVSPPNQMVSREERADQEPAEGRAELAGWVHLLSQALQFTFQWHLAGCCFSKTQQHALATQEEQAEGYQSQGLLVLCNETLSLSEK